MHVNAWNKCKIAFYISANPLPAGIITADGQQQNVMVYTTSYQQVRFHTI